MNISSLFKKLKDLVVKTFIPLLGKLEKGQEELNKKIDQYREDSNNNFTVVHKRIDDISSKTDITNKRFDDLHFNINRQFEKIDQRFDSLELQNKKIISAIVKLNKRIDQIVANKN